AALAKHWLYHLGVDRRLVGGEHFPEGAHPGVILIELLAAGERPPRDQLVDVGPACIVADLLAFYPRPGRRGDDFARLCLNVAEADLLVLAGRSEMSMLAAGELAQGFPRLDRDFPVGLGREAEDHLAGVDIGLNPWLAVSIGAVESAEEIDLLVGVPADALAAVAELLEQRPDGGEFLICIGVVSLDRDHRGHGLAGERIAFALLPILDVDGLGELARRV